MCDVSDYVIGSIIGQKNAKFLHSIRCASKVFNENLDIPSSLEMSYHVITKKNLIFGAWTSFPFLSKIHVIFI